MLKRARSACSGGSRVAALHSSVWNAAGIWQRCLPLGVLVLPWKQALRAAAEEGQAASLQHSTQPMPARPTDASTIDQHFHPLFSA